MSVFCNVCVFEDFVMCGCFVMCVFVSFVMCGCFVICVFVRVF